MLRFVCKMGRTGQNVIVCLDGKMPPKSVKTVASGGESLPEEKEGDIPACSLLGLLETAEEGNREAWHTAQWRALA